MLDRHSEYRRMTMREERWDIVCNLKLWFDVGPYKEGALDTTYGKADSDRKINMEVGDKIDRAGACHCCHTHDYFQQ